MRPMGGTIGTCDHLPPHRRYQQRRILHRRKRTPPRFPKTTMVKPILVAFGISLARLRVCSNERAPSPTLQQSSWGTLGDWDPSDSSVFIPNTEVILSIYAVIKMLSFFFFFADLSDMFLFCMLLALAGGYPTHPLNQNRLFLYYLGSISPFILQALYSCTPSPPRMPLPPCSLYTNLSLTSSLSSSLLLDFFSLFYCLFFCLWLVTGEFAVSSLATTALHRSAVAPIQRFLSFGF